MVGYESRKVLLVLQAQLEANKFFAHPKLALDAVGGASAARLADTLCEVLIQHRVCQHNYA